MSDQPKPNKGGRPAKYPGEGRRPTLSFRCRGNLYAALKAKAEANDLSISEAIERALEQHFLASDIRQIVREEIKAAQAASHTVTVRLPSTTRVNDTPVPFRDGLADSIPVQIFGRDHLPS